MLVHATSDVTREPRSYSDPYVGAPAPRHDLVVNRAGIVTESGRTSLSRCRQVLREIRLLEATREVEPKAAS
jgi:hypothetical protein